MKDLKKSSDVTLQKNIRYVVQLSMPGGKRFLDEWVVLEAIPTATKIKGHEVGIHWYDNYWIEQTAKIIFKIPFMKATLRTRIKFWIIAHL